jgi:indole-3-glycerol phosphate synthase
VLADIVSSTLDRISPLQGRLADLKAVCGDLPPARDLAAALAAPGLGVIGEIKRRSPSAGPIAPDVDPAATAAAYVAGGAVAVSVLTEPAFFDGSLEDLALARGAVDVPVLRKDFTLCPEQIWEARVAGADAVLLIVAILGDGQLDELLGVAGEAALSAVVEAHGASEVGRAVAAGAAIVGVNNRDLASFVTDLSVAERMAPLIGRGTIRVAESGVSTPDGARRMAVAGYDAILVGEAAVRAHDPAGFVSSLIAAAGDPE